MSKALFLDRDGVINEDEGYLYEIDKCRFVEGIFELVAAAEAKGYLPIVVTNQSGIARGYYTEEAMHTLHDHMREEFKKRGCHILAFYHSPFHPESIFPHLKKESHCRKPKPGMFLEAIHDHGIDPFESIMVGDKPSDRIELEGLTSYVIKSRYSENDYDVEKLVDLIPILS